MATATPPQSQHSESLTGQTILITGGASGIGLALATALAPLGARLVLGDIADATTTVASLRQASRNSRIHALPLDVTSFASQQAFFRAGAELAGPGGINTVVVNAGINGIMEQLYFLRPAEDYTTGPTDRESPSAKTLEVNLKGAVWTTQLAIAYLTKHGLDKGADRHILFVASVAGLFGAPMSPLYSAAKHGMVGLFRLLRYGSPQPGYRVNCLCPYFIDTPILGLAGRLFLSSVAMVQMGDVVDVARRTITEPDTMRGRILIVPRATVAQAREVGLHIPDDVTDENETRAVWDVEDWEGMSGSDAWTRRIVALMNVAAAQKRMADTLWDVGRVLWDVVVWGPTSRWLRT